MALQKKEEEEDVSAESETEGAAPRIPAHPLPRGALRLVLLCSFCLLTPGQEEVEQPPGCAAKMPSFVIEGGGALPVQTPPGVCTAGLCVFTATECVRHSHLSGKVVNESEESYVQERVGDVEQNCLARAEANWRFCGSVPWLPVEMMFQPSGRVAQYPLDSEVQSALAAATQPLTGRGDGLTVDGLWGQHTLQDTLDTVDGGEAGGGRTGVWGGEGTLKGMGAWKLVFSYVQGHEMKGGDEGLLDPHPRPFNGELLVDRWVFDIFRGKREGFYIDLAANDAVRASNTLSIERLGWEGLCIEAQERHLPGLMHRRCKVVHAVVSGRTGDEVEFAPEGNCGQSCAHVLSEDERNNPERGPAKRYVTVSFGRIVRDFDVPSVIDFLSLDVEFMELEVMRSFPFETHTIMALAVEEPTLELVRLLQSNGLHVVRRTAHDMLFVNVAHPDFEDVMERHHDEGSLDASTFYDPEG